MGSHNSNLQFMSFFRVNLKQNKVGKKDKDCDHFSHRKTATVFAVVFERDVGLNGRGEKKLSH